jgi:SAM-dependent methyltransferase
MTKKYYDDHEGAYRTIKAKGEYGWQTPTLEEFNRARETEQITSIVSKHFKSIPGKKALDLGCGTGPTAHTLHDLGFRTTGIDVSPTAIELAKKQSSGKDINFEVADVLTYRGKFDFIYDSHCLHCIVTEEDRKAFFVMIRENLLPGGAAFIDSMVWREGYHSGIPTLRFDNDYILWHPTKDNTRAGCELQGEQWWCPQRRIYPAGKVMEEIHAAGLKVIFKNEIEQPSPEPYMLQVLVSL